MEWFDLDAFDSDFNFFVVPYNAEIRLRISLVYNPLPEELNTELTLSSLKESIPRGKNGQAYINIPKALDQRQTNSCVEFFKLAIFLLSNNFDRLPIEETLVKVLQFQHNRNILRSLLSRGCVTIKSFAEKLLVVAASSGDSRLVELLLLAGVHPLSSFRSRVAIEHIFLHCPNIATLLLQGVGPNAVDRRALLSHLCLATRRSYNSRSALALVHLGADPFETFKFGVSLFLRAVEIGDLDTLTTMLLSCSQAIRKLYHGTPSQFAFAVQNGSLDTIKHLIHHCPPSDRETSAIYGSAVVAAAQSPNPNLDLIRYLIALGADINHHGWFGLFQFSAQGNHLRFTALQIAAILGREHLAMLLLDHGALSNLKRVSSADYEEPTALLAASRHGDIALVRRLIELGADVNAYAIEARVIDSEEIFSGTVLSAGVISGEIEVVRGLLQAGALMENPNWIGPSPMEQACISGSIEIAQLLVSQGARPECALAASLISRNTELVKWSLNYSSTVEANAALIVAASTSSYAFNLVLNYVRNTSKLDQNSVSIMYGYLTRTVC